MTLLKKNILLPFLLMYIFSAPAFAQDSTDENADSTSFHFQSTVGNLFTTKSENNEPGNYKVRSIEKQKIDSLKKLDAFWYADSAFTNKKQKAVLNYGSKGTKPPPERINEKKETISVDRTSWLDTKLFLVIIILAFAAIIFFLIKTNVVNRRRTFVPGNEDQPEESENIFDINYQKEIEKAIASGNYRLATRFMFLRILKLLATKNVIEYKQERTNLDYLMQLSSSKYYQEFFRLTRNYEYVWYGKFDLSPEAFGTIRNEFENFDRKIS